MSSGISIICEPEIDDLEGYFQELAAVYEELSELLKNEGVDILPYLFCPESDLSDEEIKAAGYTREEAKALKVISKDDFHDADEVYDDMIQALDIVRALDDDLFENGKKDLLEELEELTEVLEVAVEEKVQVQLIRG
jgi:propanediol dehydratase large subunit